MSKYCPECEMLSYNETKCDHCGKEFKTKHNKINELRAAAANTKNIPRPKIKKQTFTNQNLITCQTCGHEISKRTIQCPECGEIKFWKLIMLILEVGGVFAILNFIAYIVAFKIMGF